MAEANDKGFEVESILVVEDKERMRRMLRETLQKAGYQVAEASDGLEAINELEKEYCFKLLRGFPQEDGTYVVEGIDVADPEIVVQVYIGNQLVLFDAVEMNRTAGFLRVTLRAPSDLQIVCGLKALE